MQLKLSWHGHFVHLSGRASGRASAPGAADKLRADVETVEASWPAIYRRLQRRGVGSQHMLVIKIIINTRGTKGVWLLLRTIPQNLGWLESLRKDGNVFLLSRHFRTFP
jgi:hypothetical protein